MDNSINAPVSSHMENLSTLHKLRSLRWVWPIQSRKNLKPLRFGSTTYCLRQNVHLDIHTGLSGWLEQRCPLANLGCTFSFQRMQPLQPDTVVYHSWLQESFGLHSIVQPARILCDNTAAINANVTTDSTLNPLAKVTIDSTLNPVAKVTTDSTLNPVAKVTTDSTLNPVAKVTTDSTLNPVAKVTTDSTLNPLAKVTTDSTLNPLAKVTNDVKLNQTVQAHIANLKDQYHRGISDTAIAASSDPSVRSLYVPDKDISAQLSLESDTHSSANNSNFSSVDNVVSLDKQHPESQGDPGALHSHTEERDSHNRVNFMRVQPVIYTASSWNSKVLFQYDMEAESDDELTEITDICHNLTDLPFEVLRHIARHLDSFSLCNLSLTCHVLRDVCCSLLDECGIVLLNWQKERSEVTSRVSWKVSGKHWMFSTSFEPVRSWRFTENQLTIGDHLKVCPYNKDIVRHTKPFGVFH